MLQFFSKTDSLNTSHKSSKTNNNTRSNSSSSNNNSNSSIDSNTNGNTNNSNKNYNYISNSNNLSSNSGNASADNTYSHYPTPSYSSSLSMSPESVTSILHRQPTFSYIPIHKRRRSGVSSSSSSLSSGSMFIRSISSLSISQFENSDGGLSTPGSCKSSSDNELLMPLTPTSSNSSIYSQPADNNNYSSMEYISFPNLENFSDECWTEVRIEKFDPDEIQMESYDEMLVGGVRFQYL